MTADDVDGGYDGAGPSSKRPRMDSLSEDGMGRSGPGDDSSGSGSGSAEIGNASGGWIGGAQFGSHGVTTRMSRQFALPVYDSGNYKYITSGTAKMSADKWMGYSTPWGFIDFNRWDLHFSPRAWQKLCNNYRGIRPKSMHVKLCNFQVREASVIGDQIIFNSSPNGSLMCVIDHDCKYPYVLGHMNWGHLSVAPYKVITLPQYGYTFMGIDRSTGFFCLEGGNCQVLRTGDCVEFDYRFNDVPMLDLAVVMQHAMQTANPLLGSYMLRASGMDSGTVTNVSDHRYIDAGKYSAMYHQYLFGNNWQHTLWVRGKNINSDKIDLGTCFKRSSDQPMDTMSESSVYTDYSEEDTDADCDVRVGWNKTSVNPTQRNIPADAVTWLNSIDVTQLGGHEDNASVVEASMDGPHGQSWVEANAGISGRVLVPRDYMEGTNNSGKQYGEPLVNKDKCVSCNPLYGSSAGTSEDPDTVRATDNVFGKRAVSVRGIFPGTCWQDKDIWYTGPIWCKIPDISNFHPKPLLGGYGIKNPPPQIFLKNNPIFIPEDTISGNNFVSNSYVNQIASGQVSVEIEWECIPDQAVCWGAESQLTTASFSRGTLPVNCPDDQGVYRAGTCVSSRYLTKHL